MNWKKNLTVFVVLGLVILGTLVMSGCTEDDSGDGKVIITGSTTVKPIASKAASIFNQDHDDVTVEVSGGGSGHGIASLGKGEADIGMASREIKQSEIDEYSDIDFVDHQIAKDGVAIIVSQDIYQEGVIGLTTEEVYDIYTKEITNWKEVGGPDKNIFVVERQEGSGTRETFMDALGLDSVDSDAAKPENAQVKSAVKSADNGIGYVGLGYVGSDTPSIKLNGVGASEETIKSGDYPISRSLHMYTDGEAKGNVKDFIDFIMSSEGQDIVADEGFIPVSGGGGGGLSGTLTITGSTTVQPIAAKAADTFMDKHSKVTVQVSGGGSGHGIASLGNGEADIGDASREIKQSEIDEYPNVDFYDNEIAKDGVAIIVSKDIYDAGVNDLTTQEVYDIYTKEITTWDEVGGPSKPIFVVERQEGSGTRETFMDAIGLDSTDADAAKPENAQVKSAVKSANNGIGYVGLGYVGSDTPAIKLNGVEPTEENIVNGDYKISRSLHMYTDGEPTGLTKEFIDFIMSDEGQQIVADEGFIPMNSGGGGSGELSGTLTITGSTTVQPIAAAAASAFMDKHSKVTVEVSGGGSGHGIASLGKGEADIGDASREIKQSEIDEYPNIDFYDNEIAKDGVAIIVSKDIYDEGVTDLTSQEVHDIYTGQINLWDEVGGPSQPIQVVERQEGSGTRETFMDALGLESTDADVAKPENAQVKSAVKTSNNAIGYVGLGYVGSDTPSIKLNGVAPTEENIVSGDYKISRSLHMYTDGEPTGLTKAFIDYILSDEGQQIVADEGFIPMNSGGGGSKDLSGTLTITGSTTVQPIAAAAASAFMDKHSKVSVEVSGGGSGHGIASLGKGEADIGMASREIKQSEIDEYSNVDFYDNEIAKDGVALIVSKDIYDAGVTDLTSQEIYDIYTGNINMWSDVGGPSKPIQVVERQEGSGTRETFMDALGLESTDADVAKPENAQVKSAVKTSNNAIGYVGLGYVGSDTPAIKLDGVEPTESNIVSGDYGISRSLHMYTDGEPTGLTKAFIDFLLSDEGQQIVADEGFIPLNS